MRLSQLLAPLGLFCPADPEITAITCDSRAVIPGALFVAVTGARQDGYDHIPEAVAKGAAALVCAHPVSTERPVVAADDTRKTLALLSAEFYGRPADALTTIAITGTKGKTTTAHMVRDILTAAGHETGMIGTLGAFIGGEKLADAVNTTPEPVTLHRLLRQMADRGCTHVVMEVSSQAMKLHRAAGITFDAALFLNLTPDHIGGAEHADFAEYRACKAALFRQCRLAVGNADDPNWPAMTAQLPSGCPLLEFRPALADIAPGPGLTTRLTADSQTYSVNLPGAFNAADALAAVTLSKALGVADGPIRAGLASVTVPGRTQLYPQPGPFTVLIDYAHNGDSFRALLTALRQYPHRRIIVVFGAGGDRPKMRRRDMALAVAELADYAVVTADNPRTEPVEAICADIAAALGDSIPYVTILDRREAIIHALGLARPGDIVALLGKGHEQYIEENGVRRYFSETAVLDEYFRSLSKSSAT